MFTAKIMTKPILSSHQFHGAKVYKYRNQDITHSLMGCQWHQSSLHQVYILVNYDFKSYCCLLLSSNK